MRLLFGGEGCTGCVLALEFGDLAHNHGAAWQVHKLQPAVEAQGGGENQGVVGAKGPVLDVLAVNRHP